METFAGTTTATTSAATTSAPATSAEPKNMTTAFAVATAIFFLFGFLTCMNDILIPHLKGVFELSYAKAMMVQFCFFSAYFVVSIPAGRFVQSLGYQKGMVLGLVVASIGTLMFQPAAERLSFEIFLTGFFTLAAGITILQVAANPFVAVLGKPEAAASRLNLAQAFNSLGTTLAPVFGSALIFAATAGATTAIEKANAVRMPYGLLTVALLALAFVVWSFRLPKIHAETADRSNAASWKAPFAYPQLRWGALGIFAYVGGEVSIGSFLVSYLGDARVANLDHASAGHLVALYWGGAMVGRFVGSVLMTRIAPWKVLTTAAFAALVLIFSTMAASGKVAMVSVLAIGLFNSVMFPTIFTMAIRGLDGLTAQASGILCAAIVGGAVVPLLQGVATDVWGLRWGFIVPLICYAYVAFLGTRRFNR